MLDTKFEINMINDNELTVGEKLIVVIVVKSFDSIGSDKYLGRTYRYRQGDTRPVKQCQDLMSPYMLKILNDELDHVKIRYC